MVNRVNTSFLADNPELLDPSKCKNSQSSTKHGTAKRSFSEENITFELTSLMMVNILKVKKQAGDKVDVEEVIVVPSTMKIET